MEIGINVNTIGKRATLNIIWDRNAEKGKRGREHTIAYDMLSTEQLLILIKNLIEEEPPSLSTEKTKQ